MNAGPIILRPGADLFITKIVHDADNAQYEQRTINVLALQSIRLI